MPPVVLVVLDALHAGHVSHLGYERETTPNLDALAAEGVTFTCAIAPAPYTLATIPSILTGRLPETHGLVSRPGRLPAAEITLTELLAGAGYRTRGAVANMNGGKSHGLDQGFEEFVEVFRAEDGRSVDWVADGEEFHLPRAADFPPIVERWLAEADERPLFLYAHILEPHEPYTPPSEFQQLFLDPAYEGIFGVAESEIIKQARRREVELGPEDVEALTALYDANLRYADDAVGRILDQLKEAGLYDQALIIVTSDHGEAFWQHGEQGHNTLLYDEMLRVPLVVKFPSGTGQVGVRVDAMVSPMDVLPTVCEVLDLPHPGRPLDGTSLWTAVRNPTANEGRKIYLRSNHRKPHLGLRTNVHKTIVYREKGSERPVNVERFDLVADPDESEDVSRKLRAETWADLRHLLDRANRPAARVEDGADPSAGEAELLKRLGYGG
ncbi:MAG: sulfatase [Planctomycetota bacterium]|nr:sulfatase [Planctomycetota bacterium]